jgi:hypothetical protein
LSGLDILFWIAVHQMIKELIGEVEFVLSSCDYTCGYQLADDSA